MIAPVPPPPTRAELRRAALGWLAARRPADAFGRDEVQIGLAARPHDLHPGASAVWEALRDLCREGAAQTTPTRYGEGYRLTARGRKLAEEGMADA